MRCPMRQLPPQAPRSGQEYFWGQMQYLNKTFTLPTTSKRMTQTDYEIAVGLRNPDGTLVQPIKKGGKK